MDRTTASYYRSILFNDPEDQRTLPESLILVHNWAFKRCQALGIGSIIKKDTALAIVLTWLSSSREGQLFAKECTEIGDILVPPVLLPGTELDWKTVPAESKVLVTINNQSFSGVFIGMRGGGGWLDVKVQGETKAVRPNQIQLIEE